VKRFFVCLFISVWFFPGAIFAQEDIADQQELMNRIQDLEKRIDELTQESRARRKLEVTEKEKQEREKEVLEAVSREYTLDAKHTLNIDYSLNYSFQPYERYDSLQISMDRVANHSVSHTISTSYSVLDNMSVSASIPFIYQYKDLGTDDKMDETDIGDISFGTSFQPFKSKAGDINSTISLGIGLPTGKSPYKINSETELSTGSGTYAYSVSASFSKQVDPIVVFWNVGYTYTEDPTGVEWEVAEDTTIIKVEKGDSIHFGGGFAQALSYKASVNFSFSYGYAFDTKYYFRGVEDAYRTGDSVSASLSVGMGWRVNQKTTLSFGVGYSLTGSSFSLSFRMPFTYVL